MEVVSYQESSTATAVAGQELVKTGEHSSGSAKNRSLVPMRRRVRQPSCRLQLSASQCVRKVSLHLELLYSAIQEILQGRHAESLPLLPRLGQTPSSSAAAPDNRMQVVGVGQNLATQKLEIEAKVLTDEVIGVVIKLEEDIADTENRLSSEKETAGSFKTGLHNLRRQQLMSLHQAVDTEHSSCTVDIQELEWHVQHERRQVGALEKRHNTALRINLELRKDIDFFEKSKPELATKAVNEESILGVIATEQSTAHVELEKRSVVLKDTEKKHGVALGKINEERAFIQNDLKKVKKELADVRQAIVDSKAEFDYMVEKKARSEGLIKKNILDKQLFELKAENTRAAMHYQTDVNAKVTAELDKLMEETKELETQLMTTASDFETQKVTWDDILTGMRRDLESLEEKYRVLHQEANDLEALTDDKGRDLDDLKRRKTELETNVRRMEKDIIKYEDQMLLIVGEIAKLEHLVYAAETELKKIVAQNTDAEKGKKQTIENLKQQINQLKQEMQMLTSRYESDLKDLDEIRTHTDWKRDQFQKLIAEQAASIADKTKKVNRLEQKNNEKLATVVSLEKQLADLRAERAKREANLDEEAEKARGKLVELIQRKRIQTSELYAIRTDSDRINKIMKEMNEMIAAMITASKRYDVRIGELTTIYEEASKQMSWRKTIENELQERIVKNRTGKIEGADFHDANLNRRKRALKVAMESLGANLYYNEYLKTRYRLRQSELNDARNVLDRNALEKSMRIMQAVDALATTKFLQYFKVSADRSCEVRRTFCKCHQTNLDCQCCRNVLEVRSNCVALANEADRDSEEFKEICHVQGKLRGDAKFAEFKTVPIDVAAQMVAEPPISLSQKA